MEGWWYTSSYSVAVVSKWSLKEVSKLKVVRHTGPVKIGLLVQKLIAISSVPTAGTSVSIAMDVSMAISFSTSSHQSNRSLTRRLAYSPSWIVLSTSALRSQVGKLERSGDRYLLCGFNRGGGRCMGECCVQGYVVLHVLPPIKLLTHKEVHVWVSLYNVLIVSTKSFEAMGQLK